MAGELTQENSAVIRFIDGLRASGKYAAINFLPASDDIPNGRVWAVRQGKDGRQYEIVFPIPNYYHTLDDTVLAEKLGPQIESNLDYCEQESGVLEVY